jgi:hypothetical protein
MRRSDMPDPMLPKQYSDAHSKISSARIAIRYRYNNDDNNNTSEGIEKLAMEHYNLCTLMMYQRIMDYREKHPSSFTQTEKPKHKEVIPVASIDSVSSLVTHSDVVCCPSILSLSDEEYNAIFDIDL